MRLKFQEFFQGMQNPQEIQDKFQALEQRVHKFIKMYESLKAASQELADENSRLMSELDGERVKSKRLEEGYRNLKDQEQAAVRQQVERINNRINELVSEIDKNITLIEV